MKTAPTDFHPAVKLLACYELRQAVAAEKKAQEQKPTIH
jgi:hypothetical protein